MQAALAALQEVGAEMAELKAHCKQADHLSQAMVDVVDVFSRLEGGLAVQRACLAPGTLFRAQKPVEAKTAAVEGQGSAATHKERGKPKRTLQDALRACIPSKFHTPTDLDNLGKLVKLAKERRGAAKAGPASDADEGITLRDAHGATGRPMMACNAYLSALVAGKFLERRTGGGRRSTGISFHWVPPRQRGSRKH